MTNTQFYVALGVPFLTLLLMFIVTTVSNRSSIHELRVSNQASVEALRISTQTAIQDLRSEMRAGFADLRADLGSRIDRIEKRMDRIETRLDIIDTEIRVNHDSRLAVLEARVLGRVS